MIYYLVPSFRLFQHYAQTTQTQKPTAKPGMGLGFARKRLFIMSGWNETAKNLAISVVKLQSFCFNLQASAF